MTKQDLLDKLQAKIIQNNVCLNLAEQATQLVFGDGNVDADIVFIGEAPGKKEDEQGKPFIGAAGKFLSEMLDHINLKREDVYITNIVKYRPPNNRDPLPEEKLAFWPYLVSQLDVIQPKLVVTLGRHSMEYFLPNKKISAIHGQPKRVRVELVGLAGRQRPDGVQGTAEKRTESYQEYDEGVSQAVTQQSAVKQSGDSGSAGSQDLLTLVILPLYHPAAALYNGGMRQTLIQDFALIPDILKKL